MKIEATRNEIRSFEIRNLGCNFHDDCLSCVLARDCKDIKLSIVSNFNDVKKEGK